MEKPNLNSPDVHAEYRERTISRIAEGVVLFFELEKNLSNEDGMTTSTAGELLVSRDDIHSELDEKWVKLHLLTRLTEKRRDRRE